MSAMIGGRARTDNTHTQTRARATVHTRKHSAEYQRRGELRSFSVRDSAGFYLAREQTIPGTRSRSIQLGAAHTPSSLSLSLHAPTAPPPALIINALCVLAYVRARARPSMCVCAAWMCVCVCVCGGGGACVCVCVCVSVRHVCVCVCFWGLFWGWVGVFQCVVWCGVCACVRA